LGVRPSTSDLDNEAMKEADDTDRHAPRRVGREPWSPRSGIDGEYLTEPPARPDAATSTVRGPVDESRGHILVIVENIPLCADHRVRKQVDDLLMAGYRVSVVTRRDPGNSAYRQRINLRLLEYHSLPEPSGMAGYVREYTQAFLWAGILSVAARLRGRIDVVQLCQPPDIYFPLARLLRWSGATVVVDQRDLMPELYLARYVKPPRGILAGLAWLERRTQRVAQYVMCVNGYLSDRAVQAGARPERVAIVRNGPVLRRVAAAKPNPALRCGFESLCCWVGKIGRQDRVDLLLRAVAHLVHDLGRRDCRFAVIGDGECLDEMRALASHLELDRWVAFTGWLPEREVFSYLASADIGLDASIQAEVSPVKAMEYMAFNLPIVAFDLPETAALVAGAAVLVPPRDVERFAREIAALLDDPARRAGLGGIGRLRVATELSWERQSLTYLQVVGQAVETRRRRRPSRRG
jgi:glycosyltransferase involved in cell wall biosynthesis